TSFSYVLLRLNRRLQTESTAPSLKGNIPDNSAVTIDLKITSGSVEKLYKIDIYVHSPDLEITHYLIDDSDTGNGNFIADPGENLKFVFSVANLGSSSTSGLFSISSPDPEISIIEPKAGFGHTDIRKYNPDTPASKNFRISS
ncbi:MAG: hypothetical protein MZV65_14060, partial [Chromatiales bacterium]|nr:hypothetical protein [Chromatiales bacterium]